MIWLIHIRWKEQGAGTNVITSSSKNTTSQGHAHVTVSFKKIFMPSFMAYGYYSSICEVETGVSEVRSHSQLCSELDASLGTWDPILKYQKEKGGKGEERGEKRAEAT